MFLRAQRRWKNGKQHRDFSVVENRRVPSGEPRGGESSKVVQRTVLYLGEINDSQQAAWRKTLEVFDETRHDTTQLALFPDDRPIPPDALNALSLRLSEMRLLRPRSFGDCWLGCWLWQHLELDRFWAQRFEDARGEVPWEKVLQLLTVHRLIDPGSEYRLHRQWFLASAMDELLHVDFAAAAKDRLYRCLDRLLAHKDDLFGHLRRRWQDLFAAEFDVLLYDLTSTYFEGLCEQNPKARHGYSRDGRGDCRQVVIALIVTPQGFPVAYEVLPGNTVDSTTLRDFRAKIEQRYGTIRRTWVMDRGIPTEATLAVNEQTFRYRLKREAYRQARRRDGAYLLRTTLSPEEPQKLWEQYRMLVEIEAAFRCLKSDLAIRPVYHPLEHRVEAHILVAFLGYCLTVTLKGLLRPHAPGLTPRAVLETLGTIQRVNVQIPTTDGRRLTMPRHTQPEAEHKMILEKLGLSLPPQPPPRITADQIQPVQPEPFPPEPLHPEPLETEPENADM